MVSNECIKNLFAHAREHPADLNIRPEKIACAERPYGLRHEIGIRTLQGTALVIRGSLQILMRPSWTRVIIPESPEHDSGKTFTSWNT
jgi:hypothetical protein